MTYDAVQFQADYGLTSLQRNQCERFVELVRDTQSHTNLIGPATLSDLWRRHFSDSAQLAVLGARGGRWLDLGSGAGFPGVVLAILGERVDLVEARQKKAAFLERVIEELGLTASVTIHARRVESLPPFTTETITARALASIAQLFDWGLPFAAESTRWVLPKGARVEAELTEARRRYRFDVSLIPSRTSEEGRIVIANHVSRKFHVKPAPERRG